MYNREVEMFERLKKSELELDGVFVFGCRECGKCCKNRDDILLNARDICNIAKKLELTVAEAISRYCETYIGPSSGIPVLRLKPKWTNQVCPLLNGTKCLVHDMKPTVCRLYPLGRGFFAVDPKEGFTDYSLGKIHYFFNGATCGSNRKKQTVLQWLEAFNIPVDDVFYREWTKGTMELMDIMRGLKSKKVPNDSLNHIYDAMFFSLYCDYSVDQELVPQFNNNISKITNVMLKILTTARVV